MHKVNIGISIGDINGIGPEVVIKTLADDRLLKYCNPVIFASSGIINFYKNPSGKPQFKFNQTQSAEKLNNKTVNLVNILDGKAKIEPGQVTEEAGEIALKSLDATLSALKEGHIDAMVTAPLNKHNVNTEDHHFTGHTEYITKFFEAEESLMFLVSEKIRVGLATNHLPLQEVAAKLNSDVIYEKLKIMNESLKRDFLIHKPKIAVLGLNPHAGDNQLLGNEETEIIMPAISKAKEDGMFIVGPFAADGFFGSGAFAKFDAILAMYHDQGLIPFKSFSFSKGVNFTAGLPIVRTSPDHGTAYDIATRNQANESSFREAIFSAMDIVRNRRAYDEMTANPLQPSSKKGK